MASSDFTLYHLQSSSSEEDIDSAVSVLLKTYADDRAVEAWTAGDKAAAALLFRRSVEEALRSGECYVAYCNEAICGVAVWTAPGSDWRFHEDTSFIQNLPEGVQEWYSEHYIPKYEELYLSGGCDSSRTRRNAWKLEWLGVLAHHRHKGIGRALLGAILRTADKERSRAVAEATNPAQVHYLQHFGFNYRSVKNMSCGKFPGFPMWCLVREGDDEAALASSSKHDLPQPQHL